MSTLCPLAVLDIPVYKTFVLSRTEKQKAVTMKTQIHFFLSGLLPGKERGEVG
jgi:hypothetical protein